jgi:hypothetical protein
MVGRPVVPGFLFPLQSPYIAECYIPNPKFEQSLLSPNYKGLNYRGCKGQGPKCYTLEILGRLWDSRFTLRP